MWQQYGQRIKEGQLLLEALRGFLVLVSKRGKVLYVSETVEEYLGISQVSECMPSPLPGHSSRFVLLDTCVCIRCVCSL